MRRRDLLEQRIRQLSTLDPRSQLLTAGRDRAEIVGIERFDARANRRLLLQGADDPVVPPSQAELFRDALVRKAIPHAYRTYEGESHGFRKAENIVASLEAELSFYGQIMGFIPPGIPPVELR